jgi:hypothetical protein
MEDLEINYKRREVFKHINIKEDEKEAMELKEE